VTVRDVADACARLAWFVEVKIPVVVRLVLDALAKVVCPVTVRVEAVVVANVEVPVTTKVLVVVALVAVRLVNAARVEKKLEEDALVTIEEEAKRF